MITDYAGAISFVLEHEGRVNENVPGDPGGPTHWGITWEDDQQYRREYGLPLLPTPKAVFGISEAEVDAIYKLHYWIPVHGDELPISVAAVLMDSAVNVGTGRAVVWLQKILGIEADGAFGPMTLAATLAYIRIHGEHTLTEALLVRRQSFYNSLGAPGKPLAKFLKGWSHRVDDLRKAISAG